jgi:mRNA-degrading endonuclease toxin of MazEF toxin-antitoxin module
MSYEKNFDSWNESKKTLEHGPILHYGHPGEVWWCSLGINLGVEVDGRNDNLERPVVVLRTYNRESLLVLPLTSKEKNDRFHHPIHFGKYTSWAKLTQVRVVSAKRLLRKLDSIDENEFSLLRKAWIDSQ